MQLGWSVSKTRGRYGAGDRDRGLFFLKECCLRVRVGVKKTLTIPNGSPS